MKRVDPNLLFDLLRSMEMEVRYQLNDAGEVVCPKCGASVSREEWYADKEPKHKDNCEWMASRRVLGMPEKTYASTVAIQ